MSEQMAYRRNQHNYTYYSGEDPLSEGDHFYQRDNYQSRHLEREVPHYPGEELYQRTVHTASSYDCVDRHSRLDEDYNHGDHRRDRYTDHQQYDEPFSTSYGESSRGTRRETSQRYEEHPFENERLEERIPRRKDTDYRPEKNDHFSHYYERHIEEHATSGSISRNNRYRHSRDILEYEFSTDSNSGTALRHLKEYRDRVTYEREDDKSFPKNYTSESLDSFRHDNYPFSRRRDMHVGDRGDKTISDWDYTPSHDRDGANRGIRQSERETENRPFRRTSSSRTSSHLDIYDHTDLRVPRATGRQPKPYSTERLREAQHEERHTSAKVQRREPLIKKTSVSDDSTARGTQKRAPDMTVKRIKHEPYDKEMSFRNFSDNHSGKQFTNVSFDERICPKRKGFGLLRTPSRSPEDDYTPVCSDFLASSYVEACDEPVTSNSLLPTPVKTEVNNSLQTTYKYTVPIENQREDTVHISVGLLPTPTVSPDDCTPVCSDFLASYQVTSVGLLPTPVKTEVDSSLETTYKYSTPIKDQEEGTARLSVGLLPTPTVSQDENFNVNSTSLLSAPTWSTNVNPDHPESHISPSPACSPFNDSTKTVTVDAEREIETVIYHSRGLLPTPKGSPTVPTCSHPLMLNDNSIKDSEKFQHNNDLVESENTFISGSVKGNRKSVERDGTTGSGIRQISQEDGILPNKKHFPVKSLTDKAVPNNEKKQIPNVAVRPKQPTESSEKEMLENIQVQIQLAIALESMQKTMQTLQKKINEDQVSPDSKKVQCKATKKLSPLGKKEENVIETSDDTDCVTLSKNTESIAGGNPIDISNNCENTSVEESIEIPDNNRSQETFKAEPDHQTKEKEFASNELHAVENAEPRNITERHSKKLVNEMCSNRANKSIGRSEFKTYREWRLAKEKMDNYFYKMTCDSEVITKKDSERIHRGNVKELSDRNDLSNQKINDNMKVNDLEQIEEEGECSENINRNQNVGVSAYKQSDSRNINVTDTCSNDKMHDKVALAENNEKSKKQAAQSRHDRESVNISNQSFDYEKSEKHSSGDLDKYQRKKDDKCDSFHTHKHSRYNLDSKEKNKDESGDLDRNRKTNHKYDDYHKVRHYSADSQSSHHSEEGVKHSKDSSKSKGGYLESSDKRQRSRSEKSHRHRAHETHHSFSKERYKHNSTIKTVDDKRGKECNDTAKKSERAVKNEGTQIKMVTSSGGSIQKDIEHKIDIKEKGNLFENMAMENEIIDIISDISTDNDKDDIISKTESQFNNCENNFKSAFVKLCDITKSKGRDKNSPVPDENKSKGNMFKKMSENIFSLKDETTIKARSKDDKDSLQPESSTAVKIFKSVVDESESSSTEVDPFEKMKNFLYKDKRKPSLNFKEAKVLGSSASKKSAKRLDDFIVSDDHISDLETNDSSKYDQEVIPKTSSDGGKTKVKHLKRVNNNLYWRKTKLLFPRINLQRLKSTDIKRLKESKKQTIDHNAEGEKDKFVEIKTTVCKQTAKENTENSANYQRIFKLQEVSVSVNRIKLKKKDHLKSRANSLQFITEKTDIHGESTDKKLPKNTDDSSESTSQNKKFDQTKTLSTLSTKTNVAVSMVSVEGKQRNDDQNCKKYKRIMTLKSSSTEQSESSDVERVVYVSQRVKPRPVIFDSDESEEMEGSLGSEDSTCFDLTDYSEESVPTNEEYLEAAASDLEVQSGSQGINKNQSSLVKDQTETSTSVKGDMQSLFENVKKTEELVTKENNRQVPCNMDEASDAQASPDKRQQIQTRRNIFADMTSECSTASEAETSSNQVEVVVSGKCTPMRNSASLAKVTATLGKTLKKLKVDTLNTHSSEDSAGADFCCLPERKAALQKFSLNDTTQSESNQTIDLSVDEVDGIETNEEVQGVPTEENHKRRSDTEKVQIDHDTMTCSESAGKNIKRRKFNDSSSDSSDDEQLIEKRSATKYRKNQSEKSIEEKHVTTQDSKDDIKETQKRSGAKESGSLKHLPFKAKKLFKSSTLNKRQSTIMQMDGNADLVLGPPDESSGEEGDVEDNIPSINLDSENESSASQDLFADSRLTLMSQNFKQVFAPSNIAVKTELHEKNGHVTENVVASTSKSQKEDDKSVEYPGGDNDLTVNETELCDHAVTGEKVKDEPDWLKFGYTQELETIFLSDDDEMVMSVSQPVILVSDEETQDPDATQPLVLEDVKQEKIDYDEKYGIIDQTENYSSAEDWSDEGSDFEPENMFNSLQRAHKDIAVVGGSNHNSSECSLLSDDDLFKSQSLLEPKNECIKNDGFESSDGAVMSVNEDELLKITESDEISISSINEDELLEIKMSTKTDEQKSGVLKPKKREKVNICYSSDSDEMLLKSAFDLEDQHRKETADKTDPPNKTKLSSDVEMETDMIESSQRVEPIYQKKTDDAVEESPELKAETGTFVGSRWHKATEIKKKQNSFTDKTPRSPVDSKCQEISPYIQDTQVDPNISDEDTSNSVTVFDFYSEHFADSDTDSNASIDTKTRKNSLKPSSGKKYDYATLSDDSDIMILDNPTNENVVTAKVEQFLNKRGKTSKESTIQTQTKNDFSNFRGLIQDENESNVNDLQTKVDSTASTSYGEQTQIDNAQFYAFGEQTELDRPKTTEYGAQTQIDSPQSSAFGERNKLERTESTVYDEQTQVDRPGPSYLSPSNSNEEDFTNISDEDPQLKSYFQKSPDKSILRKKSFSQNLEIIFDSFSDSSEEQIKNEYDVFTQIDIVPPVHKKQKKKLKLNRKGLKMINAEKRISIKKDNHSAYNVHSETVSSAESDNADDYGAMTQVDTAARRHAVRVSLNKEPNHAYFAATQFEIISEPESEQAGSDEDVATQKDVDEEGCESEIDIFEIPESAQKRSNTERIRESSLGKKDINEISDNGYKHSSRNILIDSDVNDDAYQAATQSNFDDISDLEEKDEEEDYYFVATQVDMNDIAGNDSTVNISNNSDGVLKKSKTAKSKQDDKRGNAYFAATQYESISEPESQQGDDEDLYYMATQIDADDKERSENEIKTSEIFDCGKTNLDSNRKGDSCVGKKDIYEISESEDESSKRDKLKHFRANNGAYQAATQSNFDDIISDPEEKDDEDFYNTESKQDENSDHNEAYFMDTLDYDDELPDIEPSNTEIEDPFMAATQVDVDTYNAVSSNKKTLPPVSNRSNLTKVTQQKSVLGARSILKRPFPESTPTKTVTFGQVSESSATKKARVSERKLLEIEPQKLKTTAEKRASGIMTGSSNLLNFVSSLNTASSNSDIEVLDIPNSNKWLSKKVVTKKVLGKGRETDKTGKRKRRSTDDDIRARVMAAKSQLNERSMHNITHPETIKRFKSSQRATVTSSEVEDVTLPTDSQIVQQGLPLLNSTGVLLKTNKPVSDTMSETVNVPATVSTATTTVSMAISATELHSVRSTSASVTSRVQHTVTSKGKNNKEKEKNQKDNGKNQKDIKQVNKHNKHKDKSQSGKYSVRLGSESDKSKQDKEKNKSCDKDNKHKGKQLQSTSGSGRIKENLHRGRSESGDTVKSGKENKDKYADRESDKHSVKSSESRIYDRNNTVDSRSDKEKQAKKKEEKKQSSSRDNRHRHDSAQRKERERHSSSTHSESKSKNTQKDSKNEMGENKQKSNVVTTARSSSKETIVSVCLTPVTPTVSTSSLSAVTLSNTLSVTTPLVSTSGNSYVSSTIVNARQLASNVIKTVNTTTATTTISTNRRITTMPTAVVRTTASTHIQSSVLLQKQSSKPSTSGSCGPHPVPSYVTSGRQPFQPLVPNIPGSSDLMPSNMVGNVQALQWNDLLKVILKWSPNWFEEREKLEQVNRRKPPPDVTNDLFGRSNQTLYPLPRRYENFKEYSEQFMLPLLLHETWENCYSTWRERKGKQRLCQHRLMFSHMEPKGDKLQVYTLIGLISERDKRENNFVNEGELVKLTINGDMKISETKRENMNYIMSGFIDKVIFKDFSVDRFCAHYKDMAEERKRIRDCISMKLIIRVRVRAFIPNDKAVVKIESVSTIINTMRQFTALSCLPRSPLCRDLLYPTGNMTYCDKAPAIVPGLQDKFNKSQLTAINTAAKIVCLPQHTARVCLLQGPPGTGKSHTIVGIIKHLVKVTGGQCRICLCAPSNAAVDELLRRLIKYNRTVDKNSVIKLVRLGKKNSVHTDIQSCCLDNLVQKNIVQAQKEEMLKKLPQSLQGERKALENEITMVTKKIEKAQDQFQRQKLKIDLKKLENQKYNLERKCVLPKTNASVDPQLERKAKSNLLQRAHVIAGTLSSIGGNILRAEFQTMRDPAFQVVIIDEATQAIELETLIPLQYGVTKLILVGDPQQLPATVLSQEARDNKFNMSLFERLDSHFRSQDINPVILLDTQYRMDPEISAFPNRYIYDGRIRDDRCVVDRSQLPLVPYLLFDVCEGRELFSQGTRSMSNRLEAIFTAELCKFIVTQSSVIEKVIGIIAPYANQKSEIKKELMKRNLAAIEVSTVDGFQGREKHVIVMSSVRSNVSGTVGFVGNRNRMNVSLTRAIYAMYVVGHFEALESSDEWKALIVDATQRKKIIQVDQSSMKQAIKQTIKPQITRDARHNSTGSSIRSTGSTTRSTGSSTRSTGSSTRSTGSTTRSTGSSTRSTGSSTRSTGSTTRSTGSSTRSTGSSVGKLK